MLDFEQFATRYHLRKLIPIRRKFPSSIDAHAMEAMRDDEPIIGFDIDHAQKARLFYILPRNIEFHSDLKMRMVIGMIARNADGVQVIVARDDDRKRLAFRNDLALFAFSPSREVWAVV